eukprot:CAMPEP_0185694706 /NCGR_PEP_ID=MMETSP1164-20130828/4063_1 /TAXON_ID=1104430 /ORGANISM="Chrysoreinhardia sp, Strain CCMP2950" /LENGTH=306 /DNA_ID=CAMNT_0028361553 /DNA_START=98 /DNA_END=1018 /DNA_ORIENTATION=-
MATTETVVPPPPPAVVVHAPPPAPAPTPPVVPTTTTTTPTAGDPPSSRLPLEPEPAPLDTVGPAAEAAAQSPGAHADDDQQHQIERHREFMREKKRARDRLRRRLETIEIRKKVLAGEISIHPEAVRARKRRLARWTKQHDGEEPPDDLVNGPPRRAGNGKNPGKNPDEASVASILVGLLTDLPEGTTTTQAADGGDTTPKQPVVKSAEDDDDDDDARAEENPPGSPSKRARADEEARPDDGSSPVPAVSSRSTSDDGCRTPVPATAAADVKPTILDRGGPAMESAAAAANPPASPDASAGECSSE